MPDYPYHHTSISICNCNFQRLPQRVGIDILGATHTNYLMKREPCHSVFTKFEGKRYLIEELPS